MLNLSLQHKMMMKLSPQQVQYLKMLQLPTLALEQKIKQELEMNPLLEEGMEEELEQQEGNISRSAFGVGFRIPKGLNVNNRRRSLRQTERAKQNHEVVQLSLANTVIEPS
jgi:DNA-directed RNA polymerase specialized sigma54-like protein